MSSDQAVVSVIRRRRPTKESLSWYTWGPLASDSQLIHKLQNALYDTPHVLYKGGGTYKAELDFSIGMIHNPIKNRMGTYELYRTLADRP